MPLSTKEKQREYSRQYYLREKAKQWNFQKQIVPVEMMEPLLEYQSTTRDAYATSTEATVSLPAGVRRSSKLLPCFPLELYKCYGNIL